MDNRIGRVKAFHFLSFLTFFCEKMRKYLASREVSFELGASEMTASSTDGAHGVLR